MKPALEVASSSLGLEANASAGPSYVYQLQPLHDGVQVAALCSDDSVRAFHTERIDSAPAWLLHAKHEGTTQMSMLEWGNQALMLTAGRDGVVKAWDQRLGGGESQRVIAMLGEGWVEKPAAILALACPSPSSWPVIATGTESDPDRRIEAAVRVWDLRSPSKPQVEYVEGHNDDITDLHWDTNPQTLLSASSDGLVNIYNTFVTDEEDAILQIINHGSSIHHANFLSKNELFALSNDEQLSIYRRRDSNEEPEDDEDEDPPSFAFGDVRPKLDCEYIVDVHGAGLVYAGSHSKRRLDIIPLMSTPGWEFKVEEGLRLEGAHEDEIVRCVHIDTKICKVFTGGEDGHVRMWNLPKDSNGASETGNEEEMEEG